MQTIYVTAALLLLGRAAVAQETMETLSPGIVLIRGQAANVNGVQKNYYLVKIDLDSPSVEVRVPLTNGPVNDSKSVGQHALDEGATVALNANYFASNPTYPCGAGRGFGVEYTTGYDDGANGGQACRTTLGWTPGFGAGAMSSVFDTYGHAHDASFMTQFTEMISGGGLLVAGGQKTPACGTLPGCYTNKLEQYRDCTAAGISQDKKTYLLLATDTGVAGTDPSLCTADFLQTQLLNHGAWDALLLDGGGSTNLYVAGKGYITNETEHRLIPVTIIARPNGQCPSDCGTAQCVQLLRPYRAQCVGGACRAGLAGIFNCDEAKLRRAKCVGGTVVVEECAVSCMASPAGMDDVCVGGPLPDGGMHPDMAMPSLGDAGGAQDASMIDGSPTGGDGSTAGLPDLAGRPVGTDGGGGGGGSTGCKCDLGARGGSAPWSALLLGAAVLAILRQARRRRR